MFMLITLKKQRLGTANPKASNPLKYDPTHTTSLRKRFMMDMRKRFVRFRNNVETAVKGATLLTNANVPDFTFSPDAQKLRDFAAWVQRQIDEDILLPPADIPNVPFGSIAYGPWVTPYIDSAYRRGLINAWTRSMAEQTGQTQEQFLRQIDQETLRKIAVIATRTYEHLKGVTSQMATDINTILATALAEGRDAEWAANEMVDAIDGMSNTRAAMIANTEPIYAHAEGQLDAYGSLGVEELGLLVEWTTRGDEKVCPECSAQAGKTYTTQEAHGLIPFHPNCRCSWTPVLRQ